MSDVEVLERLDSILGTLEGLKKEVDGWRVNNAFNADLFQHVMRSLSNEVKELRRDIK